MTREEKIETVVKLFAKTMFYGDWKWETPNERVITLLMKDIGFYPFDDEDDMIKKTEVVNFDELIKKAIEEIEPIENKRYINTYEQHTTKENSDVQEYINQVHNNKYHKLTNELFDEISEEGWVDELTKFYEKDFTKKIFPIPH